jgi:hypothetical protein
MKWFLLIALLAGCSGGRQKSPAGGGLDLRTAGSGETNNTGSDGLRARGLDREHPLQPSDGPALHVVDEEPIATGAVDKDGVRRTVRSNLAALQACYERTLLANPGIAGRVLVTFKIEIDGTPHDVSASGVHPEVETCVADKFRAFRFPRPSTGKVEVQYPFTFRPS